jgi:hypothetical protein
MRLRINARTSIPIVARTPGSIDPFYKQERAKQFEGNMYSLKGFNVWLNSLWKKVTGAAETDKVLAEIDASYSDLAIRYSAQKISNWKAADRTQRGDRSHYQTARIESASELQLSDDLERAFAKSQAINEKIAFLKELQQLLVDEQRRVADGSVPLVSPEVFAALKPLLTMRSYEIRDLAKSGADLFADNDKVESWMREVQRKF